MQNAGHRRAPGPGRPRRVFIGPIDIAGYFGNLATGLRAAGVPVMFMDETPDPFGYRPPSFHVRIGRAITAAAARSRSSRAPTGWRIVVIALRVARAALHVLVLAAAVARCDVFIYSSGAGLLRGLELPLIRLLGKRIVWVFTGSDHRPPYLNGRMLRAARMDGWPALAATTRRVRASVALAERHADVIVAHTASAQFHRRPFARFLSIGIPIPPVAAGRAPAPNVAGPTIDAPGSVTIVHGPSDPESKGTAVIRGIVERLADLGRPIEYRELTNAGHAAVLEALAGADLLVNEVWGDTPMGVLSAEAAARAVPSVIGSYYVDALALDTPAAAIPPSRFVLPDSLEAAVRELVADDGRRRELGRRAAEYVTENWPPEAVARRYLRLIAGDAPPEWFVDPVALSYADGWGVARDERLAALRDYVAAMGGDSLLLPSESAALHRIAQEVQA